MSISSLSIPDLVDAEVEEAKQLLRAAVREHRKQRSKRKIAELADVWVPTVMDFLGDATLVACYVSTKLEPPTYGVLQALHDAGKRVLLPKLGPGLSRAWGLFEPGTELVEMAPGRPPEPAGDSYENTILSDVEAMIIPALAISREGARLGQGGGWYDRALKQVNPDAPVGAMIYPEEFLEVRIPQDEMDVSVPYAILPTTIMPTDIAKKSHPQLS